MVSLIQALRQMQAEGHSLAEIKNKLRELAREVSTLEQWRPSWTRSYLELHMTRFAVNIGRIYQDATGHQAARVSIVVYPAEGEESGFNVSISPDLLARREEAYSGDE